MAITLNRGVDGCAQALPLQAEAANPIGQM